MNRPKLIWGMIAIIAAAGIIAAFFQTTREPEFQGRSLSAWLRNFSSEAPGAHENAKAALQQMKPSPAPFLARRLQLKDSPIRRLLERMPLIRIRSVRQTRREAFQGLLALGPAAQAVIPDLSKLVLDPEVGRDVVAILAQMGPAGGVALVAAYTNAPPPDPAASPRERMEREMARMLAVGASGSNAVSAVPTLLKDLKASDFVVRNVAVVVLGRIGDQDKAVQAALLECLKDTNEIVRQNAARGLSDLDRRAYRKVRNQSSDPDFDPLQEAIRPAQENSIVISALQAMAEQDSVYESRNVATESLLIIDPKGALEAFTRDLASPEVELRRNSAQNLSYFKKGGRTAVPALVKCLADPDARVRQNAAVALREIATDADVVVPALMKMLNDSDAETRMICAIALGGYGQAAKPAVPKIIEILKGTTDQMFGEGLFMALSRIDPEAASRFQQESMAGQTNQPAPQVP